MPNPQIVLFRQDLRVHDHAALVAAAAAGSVLPLFVLDDDTPGKWRTGSAGRWWLHHSVAALAAALQSLGARLVLLRGRAGPLVARLADELGAQVHAIKLHEPWAAIQEAEIGERLTLHPGQTLSSPPAVLTKSGGRFRVFSPFWRALQEQMPPAPPKPAPKRLTMADHAPAGDLLEDWGLLPTHPNWAAEFADHWSPGEEGGRATLDRFTGLVAGYAEGRNLPAEPRTSALSPHLHWGEVSAAEVWHRVAAAAEPDIAEPFLREIGWRDFAIQALDAEPSSPDTPLSPKFARFPHRDDSAGLRAWQRGLTGYPIVDAGMRQLWRTGWMHNRVRMIASSFLVKHLLVDWRRGSEWFWDTLVDADLANNTLGWQWIMGSGYDAQPFFRIFEPVAQGRRHDPTGAYVRRWVPELAALPDSVIHAPWEASPLELEQAGVRLGETYPERVVEHGAARRRALEALGQLSV
ncbi:MAG: deoxyribodipyrimidine photo-lyase [Sphingomonadaceae bacterium]|nr:deoxyribodipyrimidine photo-lyase [Sphingomonadaceae bacterium]